MDVGGDLRRARTARQLSLGDVAARTKINQSILRAIEENRFDRVPGGLFTRGFLRAFAREVHLDPEAIVAKYREEFERPIVELPSPEQVTHRVPDYSLTADGTQDRRRFVGLAIVLLIGLAYFGYARTRSGPPAPPPIVATSAATDKVEAAAPAPVPTPTTGAVDTPLAGPLKLAIEAKDDCWVAATIDGKPAIARLMKAGEREQFDVNDRAALRIGDPASFSFTLNGMPGRVLGTAHTAVNLTFDRQNYKSILLEKPL
jgi:transcriptional regulator with XRE-family HTH domain